MTSGVLNRHVLQPMHAIGPHGFRAIAKDSEGNRTLAARKIGMSRRTFHRKLHEYHLEGF